VELRLDRQMQIIERRHDHVLRDISEITPNLGASLGGSAGSPPHVRTGRKGYNTTVASFS
jgi:hypothetical protein